MGTKKQHILQIWPEIKEKRKYTKKKTLVCRHFEDRVHGCGFGVDEWAEVGEQPIRGQCANYSDTKNHQINCDKFSERKSFYTILHSSQNCHKRRTKN